MKKAYPILCALTLIPLAGCNQHQQAEANNQANEAGTKIKAAASNAEQGIRDGTITLKVKSAMNASDKLDTSGINVDTKDRVTHLKGLVTSTAQKAMAERIARDTVGADVKVISELAIRPKAEPKEVK